MLSERVSDLERNIKDLVYVQHKTQMSIFQLTQEMKEFKEEMKKFKDEMKEFKDFVRNSIKELNKKWGDLANRLGTVVEDLVAPNLPNKIKDLFGLGEPDVIMVNINRYNKEKKLRAQIDVLIIYEEKRLIFLNETKATPKMEYIEKFVDFLKSGKFFEVFTEYQGYRLIPIFSSLNLGKEHISRLTEEGIFAVHVEGDILTFKNLDELKEKYQPFFN